jgi:hypothetical protein
MFRDLSMEFQIFFLAMLQSLLYQLLVNWFFFVKDVLKEYLFMQVEKFNVKL